MFDESCAYKFPEPDIFDLADMERDKYYKKEKIVTKPREIPMPRIEGCPGANKIVYVTEDWYLEKKKKKQTNRAKEIRDMEIEMMKLLANRDRLRIKLGELDSANKRDSKKIVAINVKLKNIAAEIEMLERQSGIHLDELDKGSRVGRFLGNFKKAGKKLIKKAKKFFNRHSEVITTVASVLLPIIGGLLIKAFLPV